VRRWLIGFSAVAAGCFMDTGVPQADPGCEDGKAACPCAAGGVCDTGLECNSMGFCQDPNCKDGSVDCPCYGNGTCDRDGDDQLECNENGFCKPPQGTATTTDSSATSSEATTLDPTTTTDSASTTDTTTTTTAGGSSTGPVGCSPDCNTGHCTQDGACARYIFVTQNPVVSGFGGLETADGICQEEADKLGLAGFYRVVARDSNESAQQHATLAPAGGGQLAFVRPDEELVANSAADLLSPDTDLLNPINRDAGGAEVNPGAMTLCNETDRVWTGYGSSLIGNLSNHCNDWTTNAGGDDGDGGTGRFHATGQMWLGASNCSCTVTDGPAEAHLYCVEAPGP
jgi:hypothetical protein